MSSQLRWFGTYEAHDGVDYLYGGCDGGGVASGGEDVKA